METLYREQIQTLSDGTREVPCAVLLKAIASRRSDDIRVDKPGCKAVCDRCPRILEYRPERRPEAPPAGVQQTYGETSKPHAQKLRSLFPQLATDQPKVVFLGSGGVFRGAFHIGVLAAMYQIKLYPDLVVDASVGTLMGGALCRMTAGKEEDAPKVLADLASLFVNVDKNVSLTLVLKSATKQLGTRAREIRLSGSELSRKVRAGSQADAGYAATGAPPVLTDALSYLLTIPQWETARITSQFIAGDFSAAISAFLLQVRKETLTNFGIKNCLMGVTLLEKQTRKLMQFTATGEGLHKVQPYQKAALQRSVAFFGTTSFLNGSTSLVLGRDFLTTATTWNAVQEGLCSSAFPAVFAARSEADLLPGAGRLDRFFADGGMFDNLPFFPAIEILSDLQDAVGYTSQDELRQRTLQRSERPNLIISAGLNQKPLPEEKFVADTMFAVNDRATTLSYESKTNTFCSTASASVEMLKDIAGKQLDPLTLDQSKFLNRFVSGTVVAVTPADPKHINPTFAFCRSLGMNAARIQSSIGDGCYHTLKQFGLNKDVQQKLQELRTAVTRAPVRTVTTTGHEPASVCPYFEIGKAAFTCRFATAPTDDTKAVFGICSKDLAHKSDAAARLEL